LSSQTEITAEKGNNFSCDRSIALNDLHEFQEAVVVVVPAESLVVEEYGLPRKTETTAKKGITFYPTVVGRSNFYISFLVLFSLKYELNPYSMKMRSCRARLK
jgi:hypothetical protein